MVQSILISVLCFFIFLLGLIAGGEAMQPTEQQTEIINKACEYIYENEPLEVYTQYCK